MNNRTDKKGQTVCKKSLLKKSMFATPCELNSPDIVCARRSSCPIPVNPEAFPED